MEKVVAVILFEDPDRAPMTFTSLSVALRTLAVERMNWNCELFVSFDEIEKRKKEAQDKIR